MPIVTQENGATVVTSISHPGKPGQRLVEAQHLKPGMTIHPETEYDVEGLVVKVGEVHPVYGGVSIWVLPLGSKRGAEGVNYPAKRKWWVDP